MCGLKTLLKVREEQVANMHACCGLVIKCTKALKNGKKLTIMKENNLLCNKTAYFVRSTY